MSNGTKLVTGFAFVGFILPLIFLAVYTVAAHYNVYPSAMPMLYLCPSSFALIALDNASASTVFIAWLLIGLSNAVLYAVVPFAIIAVIGIFHPTRTAEDHGEVKDH